MLLDALIFVIVTLIHKSCLVAELKGTQRIAIEVLLYGLAISDVCAFDLCVPGASSARHCERVLSASVRDSSRRTLISSSVA